MSLYKKYIRLRNLRRFSEHIQTEMYGPRNARMHVDEPTPVDLKHQTPRSILSLQLATIEANSEEDPATFQTCLWGDKLFVCPLVINKSLINYLQYTDVHLSIGLKVRSGPCSAKPTHLQETATLISNPSHQARARTRRGGPAMTQRAQNPHPPQPLHLQTTPPRG